jgi:hypothetical protein
MSHLPALVVGDRLADLRGRVHDERPVSDDGLVDRLVAEEEGRQDRAQVRVAKSVRTGKPSPTQWRSALRWMQRSFFSCLSSAFDVISALAFGVAATRRGIHATAERRREEGAENSLDAVRTVS